MISKRTNNFFSNLVTIIIVLTVLPNKTFSQVKNNNDTSSFIRTVNDKQQIENLINAYARCADRRLAQQQANLFAEDATVEVYHAEPGNNKPDTILRGRNALLKGFETLKQYDVTMHFNGQQTININGDTASGEVYCLAHHLWKENGKRMLMIMGIRYYDTYIRINKQWLFAKRILIFDWIDKRASVE